MRTLRHAWVLAALLVARRAASTESAALPAAAFAWEGRSAFRTFGEDEGFRSLTVECLLQDRLGFLWIGTQDGLYRYDGRTFVHHGRNEGLRSTRIFALHEAPDGRIWIGTRNGVAVLAAGRIRSLGPGDGVPEQTSRVTGIASTRGGSVLLASSAGLLILSGEKFTADPAIRGVVNAVYVDRSGRELIAQGQRILARTPDGWRPIPMPENPDGRAIDVIREDRAGRIWARSSLHLFVMQPGGDRFEPDDEGLAASFGYGRLGLDADGEIVAPTVRGLASKRGAAWHAMGPAEGLPSPTTLATLVDRDGSLWVGFAGDGLAQRRGAGAFSWWGRQDGLAHEVVFAISVDRAGALWVGTVSGLTRIDRDGLVRTYRIADGLGGDEIRALMSGDDGSMWVGTAPGGVTRLGPENGRVRRYAFEGLTRSDTSLDDLFATASGDLWAGTTAGAYKLRRSDEVFVRASLPGAAEAPGDAVHMFVETGGELFAAGRGGIQRLTGTAPRRFRKADGLVDDEVASLLAIDGGRLLAGYREAFGATALTIRGDRVTAQELREGKPLTFAKVEFLGQDASGRIWVGGGRGIDLLDRKLARIAHFGRADGLYSEDMNRNAFCTGADGTVWLGTSRGVTRYRPGHDLKPLGAPAIVELDARVRGQALSADAPARTRDRAVSFSWSAPTFVDSSDVRYRYRLEGLEEGKTETAVPEARYSGLRAGDYTFQVWSVSPAGAERAQPATLAVTVLPAWWEGTPARAAGVLLLISGIAAFIRARTHHLEKEKRRLQNAVESGRAELAAANRELREASMTDALTGLRNRRFFSASVEQAVAQVVRGESQSLVVTIVDLDFFKEINDRYGHERGDLMLTEVAARLTRVVRKADCLVRWGGEEFLVLSHGGREAAEALARRILEGMGAEPFDLGEGRREQRSCSVGWALFPWSAEDPRAATIEDVLRVADRALYLAKSAGRARAVGALAKPGDPHALLADLRAGRGALESDATLVEIRP